MASTERREGRANPGEHAREVIQGNIAVSTRALYASRMAAFKRWLESNEPLALDADDEVELPIEDDVLETYLGYMCQHSNSPEQYVGCECGLFR